MTQYHRLEDGTVLCDNTPAGMIMGALSGIPGFVDHGDGTWSIIPKHLRRVKPVRISLRQKRREAKEERIARREYEEIKKRVAGYHREWEGRRLEKESAVDRKTMTRDEWLAKGEQLFGADPRAWKFKCPRCGHVQSHESVKERTPDIGDTSSWIYFSCEGRKVAGVGCDWTLGGLFRIHKLEVMDETGKARPVFEFAEG